LASLVSVLAALMSRAGSAAGASRFRPLSGPVSDGAAELNTRKRSVTPPESPAPDPAARRRRRTPAVRRRAPSSRTGTVPHALRGPGTRHTLRQRVCRIAARAGRLSLTRRAPRSGRCATRRC
jgi:hypothetical protein